MTIAQGTQFGPYRIVELIGSGGMGEVYRAQDTRLGREVAIKLVSDRYLTEAFGSGSPAPGSGTPGTPGTVSHRRFLREAQSASVLNHGNICTIHDIGEQDGRPYLVMELLRGETLKEALRHETLSVTEVITFSKQMASALAAAHAQGIVHRDIKPANIFVVGVEGKRQIKILDFGLAKQHGVGDLAESGDATATFGGQATSAGTMTNFNPDLTSPGSTLGTVAYMSPEQAEGQALDARTDLFSLGSVMFEMATGHTPFAGASPAGIFASLLKDQVPAVSSVRAQEGRPPMPAGFDEIVAKLLVKDRTQRYQRATEVERDLEELGGSSASGVRAADSGTFAAASGVHAAASGVHPVADKASGGKGRLIAAGVIVLLLAGGGFAWWKHAAVPAVATDSEGKAMTVGAPALVKDSIILANFVNKTGDPVFDDTLNQALRIDLEQSPVINIVSEDHLRQSVKYLGKPEDTPVTPEIAREIGEREGMKAILTGTIGNLGKEYVVTLTAQNTATGDEIASEQATSPDKEHVLDALSKAAAGMRAKLGEDLVSIKKLNTPFGQATTPSLEAFRAYALGDEAHNKASDIPEAEGHYKRALEIDPNFAMAYARLGVVYENSGQVSKATEYFTKAYSLAGHVSEAERLYITAHYNSVVMGNMPKTVETLQESIQTYPGQLSSYININAALQYLAQDDKGLPYAQKAVEIAPDDAIASENLLSDLIALDRMGEAKQEIDRERKLGMDQTENIQFQLEYFFLQGEQAEVQKLVAQAAGRQDEFLVTQTLAALQQYAGQYRLASATFQRAYDQAGRAKAPDVQASILSGDVNGRGFAGMCDGSEAKLQQALALDKTKQTQEGIALAAAVCGDGKMALPIVEALGKKYPEDTLVQDVYLPLSKAFVALAAGESQQAVADAEPVKAYDLGFPGSYVQGLAYLQLHDSGNAIRAFTAATKSRGGSIATGIGVPYYAQAQLGLARAYAMAGDKVNAKKAYEAFFLTWKDADADLPQLVAGKKEYAAL